MRQPLEQMSLVYMPLALLWIIGFITYKSNVTQVNADSWVREKKAGVISCGPGGSSNSANSRLQANESNKDNQPAGNANPCAHQAATGCNIPDSKRRFLKLFPC